MLIKEGRVGRVMKYNYSAQHLSLPCAGRAGGRARRLPAECSEEKDVPSALLRMGVVVVVVVRVKGAICPGDVWGETAIYVRSC